MTNLSRDKFLEIGVTPSPDRLVSLDDLQHTSPEIIRTDIFDSLIYKELDSIEFPETFTSSKTGLAAIGAIVDFDSPDVTIPIKLKFINNHSGKEKIADIATFRSTKFAATAKIFYDVKNSRTQDSWRIDFLVGYHEILGYSVEAPEDPNLNNAADIVREFFWKLKLSKQWLF